MLETHGRVTGQLVRTPVGFAQEADGALLIAAGGRDIDWARNLLAQPVCSVTIGDETAPYVAVELDGEEHSHAVVSLIGPSARERLGADVPPEREHSLVESGGRLYVAGGPTGALFVYNSRNARLIRAFDTGLRAPASFVNDVAVAAGGDVYATDSLRPVIYRVPASSLTRASLDTSPPEVFLDLTGTPVSYGPGTNLNGIALTRGDGALLVVQSNTGALYRVDLASKRVSEVPVDGGRRLQGGDGLLLRGRDLYVVRNERERLVKVSLAPDLASGRVVETVRDRGFAYPTTLASAGGRLLVVNSQRDRLPRGARAPALPFTVSGVRRP